ncbi:DODA-type extradiol aromatic ring-opening family dioxygenase [Calidifontibacillus erzurumensis]|uniref:DODA-type extradiol aromatic ring-opening family dioxygenase n=1 Tax=Calidifontibacillus erzurumensis TaxID=2741433 RepID=UPI0035B524F5
MSIELCVLAPHVPSIIYEEEAPDYQKDMVQAMKNVGEEIERMNPDGIVIVSCHWQTTFFHYVNCTPVHKGNLSAHEIPHMIRAVPYHFPGDSELGAKLVEEGEKAGIDVIAIEDPDFVWDYGTLVPLRYLAPSAKIPVVNMPVVLTASLEESYKWGKAIKKVLKESDKRYVFIASGALSHSLVRGRHHMPTTSEHALDKEFVKLVLKRDYESCYKMLPEYGPWAKVESGGRHLAMLLAMIDDDAVPSYLGDGQSSGSWNAVITFADKDYSHLKTTINIDL